MITKMDLSGSWSFCLDKDKKGMKEKFFCKELQDSIILPTTVSEAQKGTPSQEANEGFLTDPYLFEGYTWYTKKVDFAGMAEKELFLVLERTRTSHVWMDDCYVGTDNSLCTSHRYRLTPYITKTEHILTIMVDNTSCPVKGGHMTSQDTQTNWNGITGDIGIEIYNKAYLTKISIYPKVKERQLDVSLNLNGTPACNGRVYVTEMESGRRYPDMEIRLSSGYNSFTYMLDESVQLWSEHSPCLYTLSIELEPNSPTEDQPADIYQHTFGLRDFTAGDKYFLINGMRTFLRGKHDGMIFPLTGYAPTDVQSWLKVMKTAKQYGINHYRFHTCCPPEAAFYAADILGIYMEPELPFWGTVTDESYENHDEAGQQYLIQEGLRILEEFGNHPSFVMMSMGNELWGSKKRLNEILGKYRVFDSRHLYTQGSNNFQFTPSVLENEDFFCGVRFSRERLFRGSYAMCDAPQGHIQTSSPDAVHNYDDMIRPGHSQKARVSGGEVTIQYGTGTKTVKAEETEEIIPMLPVISHEIGQYAMYPDYSEIDRYTGVLKPYNLEIFRNRLMAQGMLSMADPFFKASGRFAAECYKADLEAAFRSKELAGFQLLDLQDFTGQGTALIGILNSLMESKGLISEEEWRQFCNDTVLLAEFPKFVFTAGEKVTIRIKLAHFYPTIVKNPIIRLTLSAFGQSETDYAEERMIENNYTSGVYQLCDFDLILPNVVVPGKYNLDISMGQSGIQNHYELWVYPAIDMDYSNDGITITEHLKEAAEILKKGGRVLLFPQEMNDDNSISNTYCTDFWCYPMFRSISESMNKPVPVGTLGLCIDKAHPVFERFPAEYYTTPQWYDIITDSKALILDGSDIKPIVWPIDNFERNHRLGLIFEIQVEEGRLLVCTSDLRKREDSLPARWLMRSILNYMQSEMFKPVQSLGFNEVRSIFQK